MILLIAIDINTIFLLFGTLPLTVRNVSGAEFELDARASQAVKSVRTRTVAETGCHILESVQAELGWGLRLVYGWKLSKPNQQVPKRE